MRRCNCILNMSDLAKNPQFLQWVPSGRASHENVKENGIQLCFYLSKWLPVAESLFDTLGMKKTGWKLPERRVLTVINTDIHNRVIPSIKTQAVYLHIHLNSKVPNSCFSQLSNVNSRDGVPKTTKFVANEVFLGCDICLISDIIIRRSVTERCSSATWSRRKNKRKKFLWRKDTQREKRIPTWMFHTHSSTLLFKLTWK